VTGPYPQNQESRVMWFLLFLLGYYSDTILLPIIQSFTAEYILFMGLGGRRYVYDAATCTNTFAK
jgi:hypothetical protein